MKPEDIDFLIIGAAKSATTWLQRQLQRDPRIYMPDPEVHFFSREYGRGMDYYLSCFAPRHCDLLIGEKSNSYLDDPAAAKRIARAVPHARLICQLRNPVERAYSDYCMLYRRGEVDKNIEAWLDPRVAGANRFLAGGSYSAHLSRYVNLFGKERLLILVFEDLAIDPAAHMARVRAHLGLATSSSDLALTSRAKVKNRKEALLPARLRSSLRWLKPWVRPLRGRRGFETIRSFLAREPDYPVMTDDLRARLADHYSQSIDDMERLLGRPIPQWRSYVPPGAASVLDA